MPIRKRLLLTLYYHASYPWRWGYRRWAVAAGRMPIMVLYYHRIADDRANAWTTSYRIFARQIAWLQHNFELISLAEAQRRIRSGRNGRPCASITFDDGYAENCRQAIPLLLREKIPCTYFVTAQNVLAGRSFAHDLKQGKSFPPNTPQQLKAMAAAGIEIGAHSSTHADLGAVSDAGLLRYEVVGCGEELGRLIGRPVRYFAFPFGQHANLSREAFALARQAGYEAVCSAYGGLNFPGDDAFHLQRIAADDALIGLKNWATCDPRKLHTPRFAY
jgi:peptidoglycan/xylan/chitin deacetylase (PgdA/CDA1 family)